MSTNLIECSCKYKDIFNKQKTPMMIIDAKTGSIDDANSAACNYYSYSKDELLSMNISDINLSNKENILKEINGVKRENLKILSFQHRLSNGKIRDVEVHSSYLKIGDRDFLSLIIYDVEEKAELEKKYLKNKTYFDNLFNNSPEAIAIVDSDFRISNINEKFKEIFQYELNEIENQDITELLCEQTLYDTSYNFRKSILNGDFISEEAIRRKKDGSLIDVLVMGFPLVIDNEITGAYCIYTDISESKKQQDKIKKLTYSDRLTGLFHRDFFLKNLKSEIIKKMDNKNINEKLAVIILNINEFAIMIPNLKDTEEINVLTDRIIENLKDPFIIDKNELQITTSIGVAMYPDDDEDAVTLIRKAELAMSKSEITSKNSIVHFDDYYDKEIQELFWMKRDLLKSMKDEELFLEYQPIYDILNKKLVGVEALIRWNHKEKGRISPLKFIPIAEETGAIHPIGEWVLLEACKQNKRWQELGYEPIYISVNVSILQLEKPGFLSMLKRVLKTSNLKPQYLQLEITETYFTHDYGLIKKTIEEISNLGIKLAIDDFGTGYSSLGQLSELNINNLKIDRMFIDRVDENINNSKIVKAIIALANSLDICLIAEGVERQEELDFLKTNMCKMVQGYLFSRPVGENEIEKLL